MDWWALPTLDLRKYAALEFKAYLHFCIFNLYNQISVTFFSPSVHIQNARSWLQKQNVVPCMENNWSCGNELVMPLHVLALGKHSLFIIKPLADSRNPLRLLPRLSGMLNAVTTNWFPCLLFVMGRTQQIDALYQLLSELGNKTTGWLSPVTPNRLAVIRVLEKTDGTH